MKNLVDYVKHELKRIPIVRITRGVYVGRVDGEPTVDVDGSRIPVALVMFEPPTASEVHVWGLQGHWFAVGLVKQPPTEGVISTVAAERVGVQTDSGEFLVPFLSTYTPSSGHVVKLGFDREGLHVIGQLSEEVVPRAAPPAPVGPVTSRRADLFLATSSGSAARGTSRWFTNQVFASASNVGIYAYGSKVRDTLQAAPPVERIEIYLPQVFNRAGSMAPRLGWHPLERRGGVTPTITAQREVSSGWVDITDLADELRGGGGIGFDGAGYRIFAGIAMDGRQGDSQAGALRVTYK